MFTGWFTFFQIFRCFIRLQHARQRLQTGLLLPLRRSHTSSWNLSNLLQPFFFPRDPAFRHSWNENKSKRVCSSAQWLLVLEIGPSARSALCHFQSQYRAGNGFAHDHRRFWRMFVFNYSTFLARMRIFRNIEKSWKRTIKSMSIFPFNFE